MPDMHNTETNATRRSVNLVPPYDAAPWRIIEPAERDQIEAIAARYRKWTGSAVVEMDAAEKADADAAALAAERDAEKARMDNERLLKAMAVYFAQQLNALEAGTFTPLSAADVRAGIKALVDSV